MKERLHPHQFIRMVISSLTSATEFDNKVYFVGGCVRDELLNLPIKDIDILVDLPNGGKLLAEYLCTYYPAMFSNLVVYERFGTAKLTFTHDNNSYCDAFEIDLEFVEPRTEIYDPTSRKPIKVEYTSLKADALRRDFTINALYRNVNTLDVVDVTGRGLQDLYNELITTPTDPEMTFYDDPLRMLRAIRFACQKDFRIDDKVISAIKHNAYRLQGDCATKSPISKERIRDEFEKILMSKSPYRGVELLYSTGLFKYMFDGDTSVSDMFEYDQKSEHHNELLGMHCLKVLNKVSLEDESDIVVRLAALLHDIGKLTCWQVKSDGIHRSYHGHEEVSADKAYELLRMLKFSNEICDSVKFIIKSHMLLKQFNDGNGHLQITDKAFRKVCRKMGDKIDKCLILMDADNKSHCPQSSNKLYYQISDFRKKLKDLKISKTQETLKCPVNGNDIMQFFWITPGPRVKELLEQAQDIFDGEPSLSKDEILKKIKV